MIFLILFLDIFNRNRMVVPFSIILITGNNSLWQIVVVVVFIEILGKFLQVHGPDKTIGSI